MYCNTCETGTVGIAQETHRPVCRCVLDEGAGYLVAKPRTGRSPSCSLPFGDIADEVERRESIRDNKINCQWKNFDFVSCTKK